MLTSSDNTIILPAGYYDESTITTNITNLPGTISYTHHQCSNTVANSTYTDATTSTSGAAAVSETTVNGQTVSTTQGGCYTTPYYVWTTTTTINHPAQYGNHNFVWQDNHNGGGNTVCTRCGMSIGAGTESSWTGGCKIRDAYTETSTQTHYSTTMPSAAHSTYYLKTCGHTNGELLSATITY